MTEIVLHSDAFDELRSAFIGAGVIVGDDYMLDADQFTVGDITYKLWSYTPTAEEIARREEFRKTPLGDLMARTTEQYAMAVFNSLTAPNPLLKYLEATPFVSQGDDGTVYAGDVGLALRIRMPADYTLKDHA